MTALMMHKNLEEAGDDWLASISEAGFRRDADLLREWVRNVINELARRYNLIALH
jgi:hypothetical protein